MAQDRVRIADVADSLGLSTATVSKVIHGKTEKISDETVKRVQQELERSGYIPNMAAILLARNNSRIIGVVVNDHVKLLLLCGKTAGVIREAVEQAENYHGLEILDVADYHEAVAIADERSQPGDVVILSPASTSFDRFANFMERGQVFKAIVNELK